MRVQTKILSALDKAYCAGVTDAEGTFVFTRHSQGGWRCLVHVYNNDPELLIELRDLLGGCFRVVKRKERSEKFSISYILEFSNKKSRIHVCEELRDYLITKRKQAEVVSSWDKGSASDPEILMEEMRVLNQKAMQKTLAEKRKGYKDLSKPDNIDWAYLAGWFEGDGAVYLQPQKFKKTTYFYPWFIVYSTKPKALCYLWDKFGGVLKSRVRKKNWSTESIIKWADQKVVADLVRRILPFVRTQRRKDELDIILRSTDYPASERFCFKQELDALRQT